MASSAAESDALLPTKPHPPQRYSITELSWIAACEIVAGDGKRASSRLGLAAAACMFPLVIMGVTMARVLRVPVRAEEAPAERVYRRQYIFPSNGFTLVMLLVTAVQMTQPIADGVRVGSRTTAGLTGLLIYSACILQNATTQVLLAYKCWFACRLLLLLQFSEVPVVASILAADMLDGISTDKLLARLLALVMVGCSCLQGVPLWRCLEAMEAGADRGKRVGRPIRWLLYLLVACFAAAQLVALAYFDENALWDALGNIY